MFTGIVVEVGTVIEVRRLGPDAQLVIRAPGVVADTHPGASIAVSGVCLTVTEIGTDGSFTADLMPETLRRTALGQLAAGSQVNLEPALAVTGRLDGHIVQGHVDGVGTIASRDPGERWDEGWIEYEERLSKYVVEKGSIAVSGVSLTVSGLAEGCFKVSLIPTTLAQTILGKLRVGDQVNLETDVLAKYAERLLVGVRQ